MTGMCFNVSPRIGVLMQTIPMDTLMLSKESCHPLACDLSSKAEEAGQGIRPDRERLARQYEASDASLTPTSKGKRLPS